MKNEEMKALEQEIESSKRIIAAAEKVIRKEKQENPKENVKYNYEVLRVRSNISYSINIYTKLDDAHKLIETLKEIELSNSDPVFSTYRISLVQE